MRLLYVRIPDFEDIPGGGGNISYLQLIENEAAARIAGDDEINQQLDIIIDGLSDFENEINTDLATVQTLAETNQLNISTKTDQTAFDSLAEIVTDNGLVLAQKASQADLNNLAIEVSTKATPSDITAAIATVVGGAPAALDTLYEIVGKLAGDEAAINDLLIQINTKVRFDAAQSLTTAQQLQARQNINAEATGVAAALVAAITAASIGAATAAQGAKADSALQSGDVAPVALSGSYTALTDKPTIPAAQVNADWASNSGLSQILNKPTLFGLSSLLTGLGAGTNAAITDTDSLINALANLQAQIAVNNGRVIPNGGTTGQMLSKNSGTNYDVSWVPKPIGLVQLTEQYSNTAPNNTIPVAGFKPASGINVDYVLSPLGTGSVLAHMPDNTATGGNKRGVNAVDLQTLRNAANQVASGNYSALLGGAYNIAAGAYSVAAGFACTAGPAGVAMGYYGQARNYTAWVYGHGLSSGGGREQIAHYPLNLGTSSTTATALAWGYSGAGTGVAMRDYLDIPASFTFAFDAVITARSGSDTAVWDVRGVVARNATGNCYLVGTPTTTQRAATSGASSWSVTVQAATLGLQFIATGPAAACRWNGTVKTLETYGA